MTRNSRSSSSLNSSDGGGEAAVATGDTTTVLKKGPWTAAEDAILMEYVQKHGEGNWNSVQKNCGLARCGKSCRLRWANHLRPNLKKGSFTPEEEMLILQLHAQLGNKWARMAAQLPGRTDNEIKNFWNTRIKRRQRAGLPLYQTELQIQQQRKMRPPAIAVHSASPMRHHSPIGSPSPLPLFKQSPLMLPSPSFDGPRAKRPRGFDVLTTSAFQFPMPPPPPSSFSHNSIMMNNNNNNMFHYNSNNSYGNYGDNMNLSQSPATMPMYSGPTAKVELPSNQLLFNGGGGGENGCRLLDALLHEEEPGILSSVDNNQMGALQQHDSGSNGDCKDLFVENFSKPEESPRHCSTGVNRKRDRPEEMNPPPSTQDDISKLFDMISAPGMPAAPDWYSTAVTTAEGRNISNGGQPSVVTDEELGLELHPPADQEWNIGSCPWSNMPGIC